MIIRWYRRLRSGSGDDAWLDEFLDAADDETPDVVSSIHSELDVRLIHRSPDERSGGLSGAVVAGMQVARAPWVCVMDADLQHPPEVVESMALRATETASDMVVASRFCDGGDVGICQAERWVVAEQHSEFGIDLAEGFADLCEISFRIRWDAAAART